MELSEMASSDSFGMSWYQLVPARDGAEPTMRLAEMELSLIDEAG